MNIILRRQAQLGTLSAELLQTLRTWPWFDTLRTLRIRFREDRLGLTAGSLTRLEQAPAFMRNDATPLPTRVDARGAQLLDMLNLGLRARANLTCRP